MDAPEVFIAGPATWNRMVVLDRLPEPRPHMQFARAHFAAMGGTSAGKALGLTALGRRVALHALLGADAAGERVRTGLAAAGVPLIEGAATATEQHLNLMTPAGERVSLFLETPAPAGAPGSGAVQDAAPGTAGAPGAGAARDAARDAAPDARAIAALAGSTVAVLDLSALGASFLAPAAAAGIPIWTDLHDYDGAAAFHAPFVAAAEVAFCNADGVGGRPEALLRALLDRGVRLAVCTLGADGAVALHADAPDEPRRVAAVPVDVVDTNGAGDAFVAGFLDAHLARAGGPAPQLVDLDACLAAGSAHAARALTTRNLHPILDALPA